jgi:hypothetical protein
MERSLHVTVLKAATVVCLTLLGIGGGWSMAWALHGGQLSSPGELVTRPLAGVFYDDPFTYCEAVGTVDGSDLRYRGEQPPQALLTAMSGLRPPDRPVSLRWRCFDGQVLACLPAPNAPCGQANPSTVPHDGIVRYCQQLTDAPSVPGGVAGARTIYQWRCERGRPAVERQVIEPDARGFVPDVWRVVSPP